MHQPCSSCQIQCEQELYKNRITSTARQVAQEYLAPSAWTSFHFFWDFRDLSHFRWSHTLQEVHSIHRNLDVELYSLLQMAQMFSEGVSCTTGSSGCASVMVLGFASSLQELWAPLKRFASGVGFASSRSTCFLCANFFFTLSWSHTFMRISLRQVRT